MNDTLEYERSLITKVLGAILQDPRSWDQDAWHGLVHVQNRDWSNYTNSPAALQVLSSTFGDECRTTHCIAGWAHVLSGESPESFTRDWAEARLPLCAAEGAFLEDLSAATVAEFLTEALTPEPDSELANLLERFSHLKAT